MAKEYNIANDPDVPAKLEAMNDANKPTVDSESMLDFQAIIKLMAKGGRLRAQRFVENAEKQTEFKYFRCSACQAKNKIEISLTSENDAKEMAYIGKTFNDIVRITEFAKGNPDSRTAITLDDVFAQLKDEQIRLLREWLKEAEIVIQ